MRRHREGQSPDMDRILQRETHSTRAVAATAAAALVIALSAYGLLEAAVHAIGQQSWLIEPQVAAERLAALPRGIPPLLLAVIGAVLAMIGLAFLLHGVLPGHRARHILGNGLRADRHAAVVDDEVIASALARRTRLAANVTPEQVMVVVSQRQVAVSVRPTSGVPVDRQAVLAAVEDELAAMVLVPAPRVQVNVAQSGVIGA